MIAETRYQSMMLRQLLDGLVKYEVALLSVSTSHYVFLWSSFWTCLNYSFCVQCCVSLSVICPSKSSKIRALYEAVSWLLLCYSCSPVCSCLKLSQVIDCTLYMKLPSWIIFFPVLYLEVLVWLICRSKRLQPNTTGKNRMSECRIMELDVS